MNHSLINDRSNNNAKQTIIQRAKRSFTLKWMLLFFGVLVLATLLAPLFLSQHGRADELQGFFSQYHWVFWIGHGLFVLSTLWWWPLYIKSHGRKNQWSEANITRAIRLKWMVLGVVLCFAVVFLLS